MPGGMATVVFKEMPWDPENIWDPNATFLVLWPWLCDLTLVAGFPHSLCFEYSYPEWAFVALWTLGFSDPTFSLGIGDSAVLVSTPVPYLVLTRRSRFTGSNLRDSDVLSLWCAPRVSPWTSTPEILRMVKMLTPKYGLGLPMISVLKTLI